VAGWLGGWDAGRERRTNGYVGGFMAEMRLIKEFTKVFPKRKALHLSFYFGSKVSSFIVAFNRVYQILFLYRLPRGCVSVRCSTFFTLSRQISAEFLQPRNQQYVKVSLRSFVSHKRLYVL
jgi:hypothetical protein